MKIRKITTLLAAAALFGSMGLDAVETDKIKLVGLFAEDAATIQNISENGEWGVGFMFDNSDNRGWNAGASKWNLITGERTTLADIEEGESTAACVSNDGSIVGGSYLFEPAYNLNGKWHVLEMPEGFTMGLASNLAIVGSDTLFVGRVQDSGEATRLKACIWRNGKFEAADSDFRRDRLGEPALTNCIYDISADGKVLLGGLNYNQWMGAVTTFVTKDGNSSVIEYDDFDENLLVKLCMIRYPYMSSNGKYFIGDFWHATPDPDNEEFATEVEMPVIYDIDNNRAQLLKNAIGFMACAIDDYGHAYISPSGMPVSDPYIYKNDKPLAVKDILLANGVAESDLIKLLEPDIKNVGMFMACSADGRSIICCSGPCATFNWVAHLPKNLYEMGTTPSPVISNDNLAAFYVDGGLFLSGMVDHVEVYNVNGAMVMNQDVESAFVSAQLQEGIYVVKLFNKTSDTVTTSKILVR